MSTLLNKTDTHWILFRPWWLLSYLIESCATLSSEIDLFLPIFRICWLRSTLILSHVDSVDRDRPKLAHVSTVSTLIDTDRLICWLCQLNLTLWCSCVVSIQKKWLGHVSILLAVIDPNWRMSRIYWLYVNTIGSCCDCFVVDRPWSAHILTLSTKFDNDMLICRLCRMKLTLIC